VLVAGREGAGAHVAVGPGEGGGPRVLGEGEVVTDPERQPPALDHDGRAPPARCEQPAFVGVPQVLLVVRHDRRTGGGDGQHGVGEGAVVASYGGSGQHGHGVVRGGFGERVQALVGDPAEGVGDHLVAVGGGGEPGQVVSAQVQFGEDEHAGTAVRGACRQGGGAARVARHVAGYGLGLGGRHPERGGGQGGDGGRVHRGAP